METSIKVQKKFDSNIKILLEHEGIYDHLVHRRLLVYFSELYDWNKRINLTGIKDPEKLVLKHLGDSLVLRRHLDVKGKILDIGTGAGVPGFILKLIDPSIDITLVDAVRKKISFIKTLASYIKGLHINALHFRLTGNDSDVLRLGSRFDIIISQAVGSVELFLKFFNAISNKGAKGYLLKGSNIKKELKYLELKRKNLTLEYEIIKDNLPILDHVRNILVFRKYS